MTEEKDRDDEEVGFRITGESGNGGLREDKGNTGK
jgi:hypothetical protein